MIAPPRRHATLPSWRWGVPALALLLPLLIWPLAITTWTAIAPLSDAASLDAASLDAGGDQDAGSPPGQPERHHRGMPLD